MHSEAQNLVAACLNCLSLVVRFHGHTSCIKPPRASKFTANAREPERGVSFPRQKIVCDQNRVTRKSPAPIASASSKMAIAKSGTFRAFTRRVRTW